jgi:hypothetical protein
MKLIAGALITAVLLTGCSGVSIGNSDADVEIALAKMDACKQVNDFKLGYGLNVTDSIAQAFHKLAQIDAKYSDLADAAYMALAINDYIGFNYYKYKDSAPTVDIEYMKATSRLLQFCVSG